MTAKDKQIGCVRAASDILGDKWTPELLRSLANDNCVRFRHLQTSVPGINPRTLSARLASLETKGIITKTPTTSENRCQYSLTKKGMELIPILQSMDTWSSTYCD